jgi:hypothetical protein
VEDQISAYSNSTILKVLKVLPLLGVLVWDGSHYQRGRESRDQEALCCAHPTSNGGETQLLVVQEVSYDIPQLLHVFDCRWYRLEYNYGSQDEANSEEHRSRFVKTHLYGVLVHGIGLYADVWIDAHHKHDNNQVITMVMHVIVDVRRRKGQLPTTLRI